MQGAYGPQRGTSSTSTITQAQEFSSPTAPKKARYGKRKASDEISAIDSSLAAMAHFYNARTSAISQPSPTALPNDEDILFGTMIGAEIKQIQQPAIRSDQSATTPVDARSDQIDVRGDCVCSVVPVCV